MVGRAWRPRVISRRAARALAVPCSRPLQPCSARVTRRWPRVPTTKEHDEHGHQVVAGVGQAGQQQQRGGTDHDGLQHEVPEQPAATARGRVPRPGRTGRRCSPRRDGGDRRQGGHGQQRGVGVRARPSTNQANEHAAVAARTKPPLTSHERQVGLGQQVEEAPGSLEVGDQEHGRGEQPDHGQQRRRRTVVTVSSTPDARQQGAAAVSRDAGGDALGPQVGRHLPAPGPGCAVLSVVRGVGAGSTGTVARDGLAQARRAGPRCRCRRTGAASGSSDGGVGAQVEDLGPGALLGGPHLRLVVAGRTGRCRSSGRRGRRPRSTAVGHTITHAGSSPTSTRWAQKLHLAAVWVSGSM